MRVEAIDAWLCRRPLERPLGVARGDQTARYAALVRLRTADGAEGWGEGLVDARLWTAFLSLATEAWTPLLGGADLWDRERLRRAALQAMVYWDHRGVAAAAWSAVDIALWDLRARALGVPVCQLLGGRPHPVPAYASDLFWDEPDALAERAAAYAAAGYRAVKMHIGRGPDADAARVAAVRNAIGPSVILMVDANCAYDRGTALDLACRLEDFRVFWYEEPLPPTDVEGYADLRRRSRVPLATGENECLLEGFAALVAGRAADYLMPDAGRAGGLTELAKVCALAEAAHLSVSPHNFGGPVLAAATLHAMAAFPATCWLEWDVTGTGLTDALLQEPFEVRDGEVSVPQGPGLGVVPDLAALERWRVARATARVPT